ncbi:MAG: hypothetical protein APF80_03395 [Alphaproteobacteria bacterium BRH_c36]|nr:MAG: hypothetical protein APF80_03395 [Alphaproteobacteria bacterium BRH_c36]
MSKLLCVAVAATLAIAATVPAQAQDGRTTRIEPRPFYGATVTIEEGVRVFRPMPPTKHVIVNPGGATPLTLGFNETTVTEKRYNYNYHQHKHSGGAGYGRGSFFPGSRIGHIGVGR